MTKVSIIVPIYNREDCLVQCIDSLVNQTLQEIEIILIDDGSTDGSYAICENYAKIDKRVVLIKQKNAGVSSARNTGLKNARGEYIAFCDSDDWIDLDAYSTIYSEAIDENSDLLVFGFYNEIFNYKEHVTIKNNFKKILRYNGKREIGNAIIELEKKSFFEAPWNKLFKREIIDRNGLSFDPKISLHEDFIFNYEYVKHIASCVIYNKAFYHIVGRDRVSLSKQVIKNPLAVIFSNIDQKKVILKDFGIESPDFEHFLETRLISSLSGVLPSIYRKGSDFNRSERLHIIRVIMKELEGKTIDKTTFQGKVSALLLKTKSPFFIDIGNLILARGRYLAPSFYIRIRNYFNNSHIISLQSANSEK